MAESYVERWAREQKAKVQSEKVDKVEKVQKEKGKVKKSENERCKGQEAEEDKFDRSSERCGSRSEP